jgi:hypothetical protein
VYDNDDLPTTNGFMAGNSWKNSNIYIGRGQYGAQFVPGRIDVTTASGSIGFYGDYAGEQYFTNPTDYLILTTNCTCEWVTANAAALARPGLIRSPDASFQWLVGLANLSATQIAIQKTRSTPADFYSWWAISGGGETSGYGTKVLVCETNP